jgi:hypothetical protein
VWEIKQVEVARGHSKRTHSLPSHSSTPLLPSLYTPLSLSLSSSPLSPLIFPRPISSSHPLPFTSVSSVRSAEPFNPIRVNATNGLHRSEYFISIPVVESLPTLAPHLPSLHLCCETGRYHEGFLFWKFFLPPRHNVKSSIQT